MNDVDNIFEIPTYIKLSVVGIDGSNALYVQNEGRLFDCPSTTTYYIITSTFLNTNKYTYMKSNYDGSIDLGNGNLNTYGSGAGISVGDSNYIYGALISSTPDNKLTTDIYISFSAQPFFNSGDFRTNTYQLLDNLQSSLINDNVIGCEIIYLDGTTKTIK